MLNNHSSCSLISTLISAIPTGAPDGHIPWMSAEKFPEGALKSCAALNKFLPNHLNEKLLVLEKYIDNVLTSLQG